MVSTPSDADLPDAPPPVAIDAEAGSEPPKPVVPRSVVASYWMLLVSATLRLLLVIFTLAAWNTIINQLVQQRPAGTTADQARSAIHNNLITYLGLYVVFAALYVAFAILMRRGRNWARLSITAMVAVFAVIGLLNQAVDLYTLLTIFIDLAAVGLLYTRPAKEYFGAGRALRPRR